jgi:predicted nucleotidyltransferase
MKDILFNLSGKIDQQRLDALLTIKEESDILGVSFFVIGAFARDLILKHYGITPHRMTGDIDLGINVNDWSQFKKLTDSLIATGKFSKTKEPQRFLFESIPIDIVPFGKIADEKVKINWPPEHKIFMSIVGFKEAFENSIIVRLNSNPELDIRVPTLPCIAIMKLISWNEKYPERPKDAEDLFFIMNEYEHVGSFDRLYSKEQDLLTEEDFDNQIASIRLLGRDMAMIADKDTADVIRSILDDKRNEPHNLIKDVIRERKPFVDKFKMINIQFEKLKQGFIEALEKM